MGGVDPAGLRPKRARSDPHPHEKAPIQQAPLADTAHSANTAHSVDTEPPAPILRIASILSLRRQYFTKGATSLEACIDPDSHGMTVSAALYTLDSNPDPLGKRKTENVQRSPSTQTGKLVTRLSVIFYYLTL